MQTLLKPTDVARQLGVSRSWLYEAAKKGRVPSIRIGGEDGPLRFVPDDIERWIDAARAAWRPGGPAMPTHVSAGEPPALSSRYAPADQQACIFP